jgi:hypothetical protein
MLLFFVVLRVLRAFVVNAASELDRLRSPLWPLCLVVKKRTTLPCSQGPLPSQLGNLVPGTEGQRLNGAGRLPPATGDEAAAVY